MYVQPQKLAQFCRYSIAIHSSYSPLLQIFQVQLPHQGGTHGAGPAFLGPSSVDHGAPKVAGGAEGEDADAGERCGEARLKG